MGLSNKNRTTTIESLTHKTFDLLIIGGGLTGASIALDAATRGISTALLEMSDFGSGSSARYSLLMTEQARGDSKTSKQVEAETSVIASNFSPFYQAVKGLHVKYKGDVNFKDLTTIKRGMMYPFRKKYLNPSIQMLKKRDIMNLESIINPAKLDKGFFYENGLINRSLMAIELLKKAEQLGAKMMNYLKVTQFIYGDNEQLIGVNAEDQISGDLIPIHADRIINATGTTINQLRQLDVPVLPPESSLKINKKTQFHLNNTHIPIDHVLSFNDVARDAFIKIIPEKNHLIVTATEKITESTCNESDHTDADIKHYLAVLNRVIETIDWTITNVSEITISYEVPYQHRAELTDLATVSQTGLISAIGTSTLAYRLYANKLVDLLAKTYKKEKNILYSESDTHLVAINKTNQTATEYLQGTDEVASLPDRLLNQIVACYGNQAAEIINYYHQSESIATFYQIDRLLCAELLYAIDQSAIYTPLDFFIRRSRLNYDQNMLIEQVSGMNHLLSDQLRWSKEERSYFNREIKLWLKDDH